MPRHHLGFRAVVMDLLLAGLLGAAGCAPAPENGRGPTPAADTPPKSSAPTTPGQKPPVDDRG